MAYNHEYPYTDPDRYNSDWLLNKMKELELEIEGIEERILEASKEYIDGQLDEYKQEVAAIREELTQFEGLINSQFSIFRSSITEQQADFEAQVNSWITILSNRIDDIRAEINADIIGVNARTDLAIEQNNQYIFDTLAPEIYANVRVRNFITGELMSVQGMFDYLANLHITDGITITEIATREKTVNDFIAYDSSVSNLILHGNTIIV